MKKVILSIFAIFMVLSLSIVLVKASEATSVTIEGVQIRTDGNNGLKWVANVTNHKEGNEYGFIFAKGELTELTKDTLGAIVEPVEGFTIEEPIISATMVNFPKSAVTQDISVVAYVNDGGEYSYSDIVVRNLAEVAVYAKNSTDGEFVNTVVEYVSNNYKKTFIDRLGSVYIDNVLYETNHFALAEEFVKDWNNKFSTSLDATTAFVNGSSSEWYKSAKTSTQTSWENSKLKDFFQDDAIYTKWGWLLDYIITELSNGTGYSFAKAQAQAIINNTEDTANWYFGAHLCSYIMSIMNGDFSSSGYGSYKFADNKTKLALIGNYNDQIFTNLKYSNTVSVDEKFKLPNQDNVTGYSSNWLLNTNEYADGSLIEINKENNYLFLSQYQTIKYSYKLYDGSTLLNDLSGEYYVTSDTIVLPNYNKEGYAFNGWYTSSTFEENTKVTEISKGSTGNLSLYAKMTTSSFVPVQVTYDLNGGYFNANHYLEKYDTTDFDGGAYNSIDWGKYQNYISLGTVGRAWWYHVTLDETDIPGIYVVTGKGSSGNSAAELDCDIAILFADGHETTLPELYKLCSELATGRLVAISNIPAAATTSASINVNVFDKSLTLAKFAEDLTVEYTLATPLLLPINAGRKFVGWKSSLDGSIVTEFPGYTSNPGNITYTAQWKSDNDINIEIDLNGGYWTHSSVIENNLEGDPVITANIVRYTGNYYGDYDKGILLGDISIMPKSSTMQYSHRIGLKKIDGVYQIIQIIASGSKEEFNSEVEYVLYAAEGKDNINSFKNKCSLGDIIVFDKTISGLTAGDVSIKANLYSKAQYDAAKEKNFALTVEAPYQVNYDFKHSSLKFLGWYDNPEGNGEALSSITKAGTVYAVWSSYIVVRYDTDPFTEVGKSIQLTAEIIGKLSGNFVWESLDSTIATVDQTGKVTGVKEGTVDIKVYDSLDPTVNLTIKISVVSAGLSELFSILSDAHNDEIFTSYNLGIGAGTPVYNADIYGSVSKILFNTPLNINATYANSEKNDYYTLQSLEFVTVHYTGNMAKGANALANAKYFAEDNDVSIHYTTGNDGVYQALTHDKGAYHAGDSASVNQVGNFKWTKTGVTYDGADLLKIKWTASDDFYFEINGKKTSIKLPSTWNYNSRNTDHVFNSDGTISSKSSYAYSFSNRSPESFFNDWGFPVKVVNGEYYMGTTWWCYSLVHEGRICASGGNLNSIGIESCVDEGSDLWYTWQLTAKLVAKLCYDNNLGLERIRPHHAYTAKDCPQPMLENNMEIWWEFMDLVKYEYELLTKFSNYTITFTSNNPDYVSNTGRIIKYPEKDTTVSYTLTITDKTTSKSNSVTYFSTIPGSK